MNFVHNVGRIPAWSPSEIFHKFQYKNNKIYRAKMANIEVIEPGAFHKNQTFTRSLTNGSEFLVCVETKELVDVNDEDSTRLNLFLKQYPYSYIWTVARSLDIAQKRSRTPSMQEIEIRDLVFKEAELYRGDKIHVKCCMKDIIMSVTIEEDPKVNIQINSAYLIASHTKRGWFVRSTPNYKHFFNHKPSSTKKTPKPAQKAFDVSGVVVDSDEADVDSSKNIQSQNIHSQKMPSQNIQSDGSSRSIDTDESNRCRFQAITFTSDHITIETETRTERFKISHVHEESKTTSQFWCAKTIQERFNQYDDILKTPFNLFDLVRENKAHGLIFIHYDELVTKEVKTKVIANWKSKTRQPMPNPFAYIIFDKAKAVPFVGKFFDF